MIVSTLTFPLSVPGKLKFVLGLSFWKKCGIISLSKIRICFKTGKRLNEFLDILDKY